MKRFVIICTAAALLLVSSIASAASIVGTAHDFSNVGSYGEICVFCHTPHDSAATGSGPLWNRAGYTASGFSMYPLKIHA